MHERPAPICLNAGPVWPKSRVERTASRCGIGPGPANPPASAHDPDFPLVGHDQTGTLTEYRDSADRQQVREWGLRAGRQLEEGQVRDAETHAAPGPVQAPRRPAVPIPAGDLPGHRARQAGRPPRSWRAACWPRIRMMRWRTTRWARVLLEGRQRRQAFREFARARALAAGDQGAARLGRAPGSRAARRCSRRCRATTC